MNLLDVPAAQLAELQALEVGEDTWVSSVRATKRQRHVCGDEHVDVELIEIDQTTSFGVNPTARPYHVVRLPDAEVTP